MVDYQIWILRYIMVQTREEKNAQSLNFYHKNKVEITEKRRENKETISKTKKKYRKSRKGHVQTLIDKWRKDNVKYGGGDLRDLADKYFKTDNCELCDNDISGDTSKISLRNMDHNHSTLYFRWVCCRSCNIKLGKTDNNFRMVMKELKFVFRLPPVFKLTEDLDASA